MRGNLFLWRIPPLSLLSSPLLSAFLQMYAAGYIDKKKTHPKVSLSYYYYYYCSQ